MAYYSASLLSSFHPYLCLWVLLSVLQLSAEEMTGQAQSRRHSCANTKGCLLPKTNLASDILAMDIPGQGPAREKAPKTVNRKARPASTHVWTQCRRKYLLKKSQVCSSLHTYIVDQVDAPPPRRGHWFYYPRSPVLWIWIWSKYWEIKREEKKKKEHEFIILNCNNSNLLGTQRTFQICSWGAAVHHCLRVAPKREFRQEEAEERGG